jgi:acetyltransferase-like isoleucine patch superfamily enzyme
MLVSILEKERKLPVWRRSLQRMMPQLLVSVAVYVRDRAMLHPRARVQLTGKIRFGRGTVVKALTIIQASGGRIIVGRRCAIGSFNHIAAGLEDLVIGDDVRTGPHVSIVATTREYRRTDTRIADQGYRDQGISIGNDVLIGTGAIILDGSRIGHGAVIGAGSLVRGTIPPYAVAFGSPAKVSHYRGGEPAS